MALVELAVGAAGRGRLRVDGVDLSAAVTAVQTAVAADDSSTVTLHLSAADQDMSFGDTSLRIAGIDVPESVQRALYEHLAARYGG